MIKPEKLSSHSLAINWTQRTKNALWIWIKERLIFLSIWIALHVQRKTKQIALSSNTYKIEGRKNWRYSACLEQEFQTKCSSVPKMKTCCHNYYLLNDENANYDHALINLFILCLSVKGNVLLVLAAHTIETSIIYKAEP